MTTVFFSYQDHDENARVEAESLGQALTSRGLKVLLESDKREIGANVDEVIYDRLSKAHAVVSVLFPGAIQSHWIQFEARTAKLQHKWYPVTFGDVALPESLMGSWRLDGIRLKDAGRREAAIDELVASIKSGAGGARYYSGRSFNSQAARVGGLTLGGLFALLGALFSFLASFDTARQAACSPTWMESACTWAGWPPERDHKSGG